jgi:hypothetical protein
LLKNQLEHIIDSERLKCFKLVDFATGWDHGGERFWMLFKIIFRFSSKESTTSLYEIVNMSNSKDGIKVLKKSVHKKVAVGLKRTSFNHLYIVTSNQDGRLLLSFD